MNIIQTGLSALGWHGGTIWQVIDECHKRADKESCVYRYGKQTAKQFPSDLIFSAKVPVNSWSNDAQCSINWIAGYCKQLGY
jgi:hypothetical protein